MPMLLGGSSGSIEKTNEWRGALEQMSTIVTDFGADLAEVILKGGTFKEVMTGALESVATVILAACWRAGHGPVC